MPRREPSSNTRLEQDLRAALGDLAERELKRALRPVAGRQGRAMQVGGRDVLMFAGSNYLDLAGDPRVVAAAQAATELYGTAAGGARLINGNLEIHDALERELAEFAGCEAALLFSTGYMANLGVLTALAGPDDAIVSDSLNHASIVDACRLSRAKIHVFRHNDPEDLTRVARELAGFRRRILVVDGVYSMDGDVARLRELVPIARAHDMVVVLDDAHGLGVLGSRGLGTAELCGVQVDVQIGNLGKAFGSFGAYALCSATLREWLLNTARSFVFTCALPPGAIGAARAALEIVRGEPERRARLQSRAAQLRSGLQSRGWDTGPSTTQIVPALVGDNARTMALCERALARGVYAQGIRYPSVPAGTARIRLTPMCSHTRDDIDRVVALFAELAA